MSWESPHTKAFLLLQAHLFQREVPIADYKTDLKSVLDRTIPIIQALVDIAAEEAQWRTCLNLISLLQCIHQATHPWRTSLCTLPYLGNNEILKVLKKYGIESLPQLVEKSDSYGWNEWKAKNQKGNSKKSKNEPPKTSEDILKRTFADCEATFFGPAGIDSRRKNNMLRGVTELCKNLPKLRIHFDLYEVKDLPEEEDNQENWKVEDFPERGPNVDPLDNKEELLPPEYKA